MRSCLFPLVFVCLFFALPAFSQRVVEGETTFATVGGEGVVRLAIESPSPTSAYVNLDLLDTSDVIRATAGRQNIELPDGKQIHEFRMKLDDLGQNPMTRSHGSDSNTASARRPGSSRSRR
jgi:hypothetical protein